MKRTVALAMVTLGVPAVVFLAPGCGEDCHGDSCAEEDNHGGGGPGGASGVSQAVETYCTCVFDNCHDLYHDKWGDDENVAWQTCLSEAAALPSAGSPQTSGNSIECRQSYCDQTPSDESQCPAAMATDMTCQ